MLHVPTNIRQMQIPSPTLSPTIESKDFIPKEDTAPIVIESVGQAYEENQRSVESPLPQQNIHTQSLVSNVLTVLNF